MHLIGLLLAAGAQGQPSLTVTGTCPGAVQVDMLGVTPGATVAVLAADAPGEATILVAAPCGGTETGLQGINLVATFDDTDNDGELHESPNLPNAQCGRFVQVVDLSTCETSNVVQLLTGTCEVSGRMALIPGGWFTMGSNAQEVGRGADELEHSVKLTHSYCLDKTEVTQAEFESVMGYNPSWNQGCSNCPVESVSWHESAEYANAVSTLEGLTPCYNCNGGVCGGVGNPYLCEGYRLATEAEWERAAKGGPWSESFPNGGTLYVGDANDCGGNLLLTNQSLLDDVAWYCGNQSGGTEAVGLLLPNPFGLYDMSGNVWEWTGDWYGEYGGIAVDPYGGQTGIERVDRGGYWGIHPRYTRVAERGRGAPTRWNLGVGLRLSRSNP